VPSVASVCSPQCIVNFLLVTQAEPFCVLQRGSSQTVRTIAFDEAEFLPLPSMRSAALTCSHVLISYELQKRSTGRCSAALRCSVIVEHVSTVIKAEVVAAELVVRCHQQQRGAVDRQTAA
jgi:hypothetical protein